MKIFSVVTLAIILAAAAAPTPAHAGAKNKRTPSNVEDCTEAAGRHVSSYLKNPSTLAEKGLHHELYKKFAGKNGYNELVYTYMYKITDKNGHDKGIVRATENHKCEYTSIGMYKNEEDMDSDDRDAAQGGGSEG